MKFWVLGSSIVLCAILLVQNADPQKASEDLLARHRNLGKAFYENPTTQNEAVEEFRKAFQLAPSSVPERLNFGLALLRAGKTAEAITELEKVQKLDPKLPHTYFNLGITFKKQGEQERAIQQFERMVELAPEEPISHYNLGTLYKLTGKLDAATQQFQLAAKLDPNLAAPHFQLYNAYRLSGQQAAMRQELETFQRIKKQQEGAAIPEDVEWSAYAEIYDVMEDRSPPDSPAPLKFQAKTVAPGAVNALAFDAAGDGKLKVLAWSPEGLQLDGQPIVPDLKGIVSVTGGDFNNDGLMDFCVLTKSEVVLLANNKGKLARSPERLPVNGSFEAAVWLDYDHDYDLDLFLLGTKPVLLRNQGSAGFADRTDSFPFKPGHPIAAAAFRLVADTKGWDLLVSYAGEPSVLYRDKLQGVFAPEPASLPAGATKLAAEDLNNDGWIDVAYVDGAAVHVMYNRAGVLEKGVSIGAAGGGYTFADLENRGALDLITAEGFYRNQGKQGFAKPLSVEHLTGCAPLTSADLNGDFKPDLLCASQEGVQALTNITSTRNTFIGVKITGIKNLKLSPGAEVEVKAGPRYQKKMYRGVPLIFGVGRQPMIDTVRITWPNGLIQNEIKQAAGKLYSYQEAQRLSGSCPIIWSWNGQKWEYITDVLGVAPLGASSSDGQYFAVDHDEYIQIPGNSLRSVDGRYQIRITEELSEVAYLDQIRLIAVDHSSDTAVYTNEKFKGPPFPEFRLFGVTHPIRPLTARDETGRDVRAELLKKDGTYPDRFSRTLAGVAKLHSLDLDFGPAAVVGDEAILVLSGWVDWADGSTFLGVAQEGKGLVAPYLQVRNAAGDWQTVIQDLGMPAGKPKSIAVDLTGKFLSASREVRIVTSLCVYWDEIFLSSKAAAPDVKLSSVPLKKANLHFRGFSPSIIDPTRKQPERFVYEDATPTSLWNPTPGYYTRYGDVSELAGSIDDKLIVMGSGDEVALRFDSNALPPLPGGWTRDFLLFVDGWAKDRDANTAHSQSTGPLPFHKMTKFPYGPNEMYPNDREHRDYQARYNTRPGLRLIRPLVTGPMMSRN